jgi:hypothetical protein
VSGNKQKTLQVIDLQGFYNFNVTRRESNHPITILKINVLQNQILACSPNVHQKAVFGLQMVIIKVGKNDKA